VFPQVVAQVVPEPEVGPPRFDSPRFGDFSREVLHHQMVGRAPGLFPVP